MRLLVEGWKCAAKFCSEEMSVPKSKMERDGGKVRGERK
jgi:hypothetical protein